MTRRPRALCYICGRRVGLRRDGALGAHDVKIYDGWGGKLATLLGTVRCAGVSHRPDDPELRNMHQTCGWCGKSRGKLDDNNALHEHERDCLKKRETK